MFAHHKGAKTFIKSHSISMIYVLNFQPISINKLSCSKRYLVMLFFGYNNIAHLHKLEIRFQNDNGCPLCHLQRLPFVIRRVVNDSQLPSRCILLMLCHILKTNSFDSRNRFSIEVLSSSEFVLQKLFINI